MRRNNPFRPFYGKLLRLSLACPTMLCHLPYKTQALRHSRSAQAACFSIIRFSAIRARLYTQTDNRPPRSLPEIDCASLVTLSILNFRKKCNPSSQFIFTLYHPLLSISLYYYPVLRLCNPLCDILQIILCCALVTSEGGHSQLRRTVPGAPRYSCSIRKISFCVSSIHSAMNAIKGVSSVWALYPSICASSSFIWRPPVGYIQ